MSPESAIYEHLKTAITAAASGDSLFEVELHPTVYSRITKQSGVRIGNCESDLAPHYDDQGEQIVKDFNAVIPVEMFAKVENEDDPESFVVARERVRTVQLAVAARIFDDSSLSGGVCDVQIVSGFRGWAKIQTNSYAVSILQLLINQR